MIPQHAISVGGGMHHLRKRLTGAKCNNNNDIRKVRWMLFMFNIKNDNKTYRIPCLSTRSINPQHVIGVGGPLGSFVTPLTEP